MRLFFEGDFSKIRNYMKDNSRYWYLILAFFVGLRLSRTTAELLQTREAERARRVDDNRPSNAVVDSTPGA
jgi:hypothetical protein